MNYHRLPAAGPRTSLPAFIDQARGLEPLYRAEAGRNPPARRRCGQCCSKCCISALKYKLLIACSCCFSLLIGLVVTLLTTKMYVASTTVKIDRVAPKILNNQTGFVESRSEPGFWQTQLELIKSRALAERVAISLNLAQTDFVNARPPSLWSRISGRNTTKNLTLHLSRRGKPLQWAKSWAASASNPWRCPLSCASVIMVRTQGGRSALASRRRNSSSVQRLTGVSARPATRGIFLRNGCEQLKIKLQDSEKQLIDYAQQRGIVNVDDKQPEAVANLQAVQNALSIAVTERLKREQLWLLAQSANAITLPQAMNDGLITGRTRSDWKFKGELPGKAEHPQTSFSGDGCPAYANNGIGEANSNAL